MKLATFVAGNGAPRIGIVDTTRGQILDLAAAHDIAAPRLPNGLDDLDLSGLPRPEGMVAFSPDTRPEGLRYKPLHVGESATVSFAER